MSNFVASHYVILQEKTIETNLVTSGKLSSDELVEVFKSLNYSKYVSMI